MDFKQGSKVSLLLQLATQHGITVGDPAHWIFSPPVDLGDADPSGKNTKIKLTAIRPNPNHLGFRTFTYNRIDLDFLAINLPNHIPRKLPEEIQTTYQAFDFILKQVGVKLEASDVEDLPVIDNGDGSKTIQLVARDSSILWIGAANINTSDLPNISLAISPPSFEWS